MRDTLVTFETAESAKEKGFDICTYSDCWLKTLSGEIIHNSERYSCIEHDRAELYLSQPTQTALQKWLREVHNIHANVEPHWTEENICDPQATPLYWGYYIATDCEGEDKPTYRETYEGALEIALFAALKEIKI